jgi:SEC-C motif-containing protein
MNNGDSSQRTDNSCPCGSLLTFTNCCGPFLTGNAVAPTAEALMRSRYSAFCFHNSGYLIQTLHPSKRSASDKQDLESSFSETGWLSLNIMQCSQGKEQDKQGQVEFIARYCTDKQLQQLHERSNFVRENGLWFYVDGKLFDSTPTLPGRNEPCWCQSGQKFKKCHGS